MTQPWHYINLPYPSTTNCHNTTQPYNVVWAIKSLEKGFQDTHNQNVEAVLMTLEEHYVGDVNQPLHVLIHVNNSCQGDEGGNGFCLKQGTSGKCTQSLHALWDNAVGFIKPKMNIAQDHARFVATGGLT